MQSLSCIAALSLNTGLLALETAPVFTCSELTITHCAPRAEPHACDKAEQSHICNLTWQLPPQITAMIWSLAKAAVELLFSDSGEDA